MWIHYPDRIQESVDTLLAQERRLRRSAIDRVKMLRLLKSGRYRSQSQLAPLLGHSDRTLRRWWQLYQQQGLAGLLADRGRGGSRLPPKHARDWTAMQAGHAIVASQQQFGIVYHQRAVALVAIGQAQNGSPSAAHASEEAQARL